MRNPYQIYVENEYYRSVATAMAAENLVIKKLRDEGASQVFVNFNGHAAADFKREDLDRVVFGKRETFLINDIERGAESVKHLPPALRGKSKRAVVGILRGAYGGTEAEAVRVLGELKPYLK